jgi:outer membrane translocation and assembly module TamA
MRDRLRSQGYMKPQAKTERKVNEEKKAVDLRVLIDPGPVYKFGKLSIVGLDIVGEPAVRKLWAIKEGQPFNSGYPQYFLDRIRQDGLFDDLGKTKYELKVDDQVHVVDVTLSFAGAPPPEKKKQPY